MQCVIQPHLYEPQNELEIKRTIERLSSIQNPVSCEVSKQYEENPYPRWTSVSYATRTDYGQALVNELPGFTPPSFLKNHVIKVLVAGCGTGRHAIQLARSFRNVEITAIDLSRSSLAYATKMAKQHDVSNIEFYQADILELESVRDRFHIIESSGVLHHMDNPLSGWQSLINLLEPGGLIKVGLYSERARQVITTARRIIDENQLTPSDEHIRIFRQAVFDNLIDADFSPLKRSSDFYNLSGCRDLLFHVKEHLFSPMQIANALDQLNLQFLGFVNLPYSVKQSYDNRFGDDTSRTQLTNWDQLETENPAIFDSMYQFYCQVQPGEIRKIGD